MEKEFSLSDYQEKDATGYVYPEEKLKQFIKLLKEVFRIKEVKIRRALRAHSLGNRKGCYELEVIKELTNEIDALAGKSLVE